MSTSLFLSSLEYSCTGFIIVAVCLAKVAVASLLLLLSSLRPCNGHVYQALAVDYSLSGLHIA